MEEKRLRLAWLDGYGNPGKERMEDEGKSTRSTSTVILVEEKLVWLVLPLRGIV